MNLNKLARLVVIVLSILSIVFLATIMMSDAPDGGMILPIIYIAYLMIFIAIIEILDKKIRNDWGDHCVEQRICLHSFG